MKSYVATITPAATCGRMAPEVKLTVDHVVPEALGGSDKAANLVTACADCNGGKTSISPDQATVEDASADAIRWSQAMKEAAEIQQRKLKERKVYRASFKWDWDEAFGWMEYWIDDGDGGSRHFYNVSKPEDKFAWAICKGETIRTLYRTEAEADHAYDVLHRRVVPSLPTDWEDTLDRWFVAGVSNEELSELARVTASKDHVYDEKKWRYFCGCVWNVVRTRQEIAAALLAKKVGDEESAT